jgi:hypothetical protein
VLVLVQGHFLWHFPYLERIQGVRGEVPRGPTPRGPPELAAAMSTARRALAFGRSTNDCAAVALGAGCPTTNSPTECQLSAGLQRGSLRPNGPSCPHRTTESCRASMGGACGGGGGGGGGGGAVGGIRAYARTVPACGAPRCFLAVMVRLNAWPTPRGGTTGLSRPCSVAPRLALAAGVDWAV